MRLLPARPAIPDLSCELGHGPDRLRRRDPRARLRMLRRPSSPGRPPRRSLPPKPPPAAHAHAARARRGEQGPGQVLARPSSATHGALHPDRAPPSRSACEVDQRRGLATALGHRPRRGHPAADPRQDLPAVLARRHVPHPRTPAAAASASPSSPRSSKRTRAPSTCSRRRAGGRRSELPFLSSPRPRMPRPLPPRPDPPRDRRRRPTVIP